VKGVEDKLLFLYLPFGGHKTILWGGPGETFFFGMTQLTLKWSVVEQPLE